MEVSWWKGKRIIILRLSWWFTFERKRANKVFVFYIGNKEKIIKLS